MPDINFQVTDQTLSGPDSMSLQLPAVTGAVQDEGESATDGLTIVALTNTRVIDDQSLSADSKELNSFEGIEFSGGIDRDPLSEYDGAPVKLKYIDLQHLEIREFETMHAEIPELNKFVPDPAFFGSLEELGKDLEELIDDEMDQTQTSASVAALVVATGLASWVLRASSLFGGFLSMIPFRRSFRLLLVPAKDDEKQDVTTDDKE